MLKRIRPLASAGRFRGLSISKKFILIYVIGFAIPIFIYAVYSFSSANVSIQKSYYEQSLEALGRAEDNVNRNIDICETALGTVCANTGFLEFINGDMGADDLALIQFKRNDYAQITNLKDMNPNINNIECYIDNSLIYKLPPVLNGQEDFPDKNLYSSIIGLKGSEYFQIDGVDSAADSPVHVVSLFRALTENQPHPCVVEVNMLQSVFFQDLFANETEENSILLIAKAGSERYLYDDSNRFYKLRKDNFGDILQGLSREALTKPGSFEFRTGTEEYTVLYRYIGKLDAYLYQLYSLNDITKRIDVVRNQILIAVLVALLALCLLSYLLTSILLKKLKTVVSSMHLVQAGDLNVTVPARGHDEIDELARHFNQTLVHIKDLIAQLLNRQLAAKDAEIKALQSQINSHFIYNALESIRMLAETGNKPEISDAIFSLGKQMRYSMRWKDQHVTLDEELSMARNYVQLINTVSDFSITLTIHIPETLKQYRIPKMSIEPLVENAVSHGIEPRAGDGTVVISAAVVTDAVVIEVADDGVGMEPETLEQVSDALSNEEYENAEPFGKNGIGLLNVHKRIQLFCGKQYGLTLQSEKGRYTRVVMRLPFDKGMGGW